MKTLRLFFCAVPLAVAGCSGFPGSFWNPFASAPQVTEQGVGNITTATPLQPQALATVLGSDYRLRSGMKSENGATVRYVEALKEGKVALVINGDKTTINRIEVMDADITTASGVKVATPFSQLYSKAFGHCRNVVGDDAPAVECKAEGSQHISYLFTGQWRGPEELMPPDETLKNWRVKKIIWRR